MNDKAKTALQYLILLMAIPAVMLLGVTVFKDRGYAFIALAVAVLACIPFFMSFEKSQRNGKLLIIIAVMIAMSSAGRFIFAALPHFKPVTALVVITAITFGPQAGFVTGALTAVISNFYFGQGPWTPFQMFAWGTVGLIAGWLAPLLCGRGPMAKILLLVYGVLAGVFYSLLMDTWTTLWWDGTFNFTRYAGYIITAVPVTITYAVSNVIFLLAFTSPIGSVLDRMQYKYGIGEKNKGR
jgi:energy-coupling factor transport system substrate-specific component